MNHAELRNYAPQARRDFIQAVTDRAAFYGVTVAKNEPITEKGDVAIIAGHAFPASVVPKRKKLVDRIKRDGFNQTMEALAYTWFNRFVAIRFMELHGYLEHGYRVLSHPDPTKTIPEILELAEHVDLPGLNKEKVIDLKLDVNKESELYRMLLLAQCHALHSAMPFLFEGIDDETELVLPENLLHSDSIIRKLVAASEPEDWQEVEVLGWLYQFYISKRKDEVMARKSAVPTEDIPAVTQLFTPHWIVRYLVENSLGRLWLLNRPGSRLREQMPYYIEGESEADFLKITKPEEIRLLDPACGSGHMLTYAFELLFRIYEEEGYAPSEIPALILRHNLYGLEICPRAAQLANLALVFKAREKYRRFIQPGNLVAPRILALQNIRFDEGELRDYIDVLDIGGLFNQPMLRLLHQFKEAATFGSLIRPMLDVTGIAYARQAIQARDLGGQLFLQETHVKVLRVLEQAEMLCQRYHVVVANPPYMKGTQMPAVLKTYTEREYPDGKANLFACFLSRSSDLPIRGGYTAMITLHGWMFTVRYEDLRQRMITTRQLVCVGHLGAHAFDSIGGEVVQTTMFVMRNSTPSECPTIFHRLVDGKNEEEKHHDLLIRRGEYRIHAKDFLSIDGAPMAYWLPEPARKAFADNRPLGDKATIRAGLQTGENDAFLRYWHEVEIAKISTRCKDRASAQSSHAKWFPHNKGGGFRKWYGLAEYLINWENDGAAIKRRKREDLEAGRITENNSKCWNQDYYFRDGFSWSALSTGSMSARANGEGFLFDTKGQTVFPTNPDNRFTILGYLNSRVSTVFLEALSPTLDFNGGTVAKLPLPDLSRSDCLNNDVKLAVNLASADWDNFETSWDFHVLPLLRADLKGATLESSWRNWEAYLKGNIAQMQGLETENNRIWIEAYGMKEELKADVSENEITLARPDRRKDVAAFLSYAVGSMMGRYSLDQPGLILANAGDSVREFLEKVGVPQEKLAFAPNEDGIITVLEGEWFKDDIVARTRDFLRTTFGEATIEANLRFIEESLGKELRKYFLTDFYKDHLQTYKKRPIYWLFSSGKERAFQGLVYLHRYHEGTLSRMRTEYVIPLQGKIASRIDQLADDIQKATSTSHRKKMEKERDTLLKQRTELQAFDEKLRHYADQRIQLDLDDGVKVNYGKFGDLLAEVKAVTGGSDE